MSENDESSVGVTFSFDFMTIPGGGARTESPQGPGYPSSCTPWRVGCNLTALARGGTTPQRLSEWEGWSETSVPDGLAARWTLGHRSGQNTSPPLSSLARSDGCPLQRAPSQWWMDLFPPALFLRHIDIRMIHARIRAIKNKKKKQKKQKQKEELVRKNGV